MTAGRIHAESTTVILLGSFNPRIFDPLWFSENQLLPAEEAKRAEVQMIDRDFCRLHFGWAELVVVQGRLQLRATPETVADAQIRDLLVGLLKLLPHTPIEVGSIHHRADLAIAGEEQWHAVGDALAPNPLWEGILDQPRLFDFAMQGSRPDDLPGAIKVRIQPSRVVEPGVFMNVNDEFSIARPEHALPTVADILEELWPQAESRANEIREQLLARLLP
jgi:hypothetical protein